MRYEHRNGESEAPTIDGDYWFSGICTVKNSDLGQLKHLVSVYSVPDGAAMAGRWVEVPVQADYNQCEYTTKPDNLSGRWWGPVFAPWHPEGTRDE